VKNRMSKESNYSTGYKVITVEKEAAPHNSSVLRKPICIQGMPGVAMCGKTAVDYMIEESKAKLMYEFYFYDLSSHVKVDDKGRLSALRTAAYLCKEEKRDFILVTGDGQPANGDGINTLSYFLAEQLRDLGARAVISLAASPVATITMNPSIYVASTSKSLLDLLVKNGAKKLNEGTIVGMNGVIPCLSERLYGIPGCILLAEACQALPTDPSASKALVDILRLCFRMRIDSTKLSAAADKLFEAYGVKNQKRPSSETEYIS